MADIEDLKGDDRINHTNIIFNFDSTESDWDYDDETFTSDDKFDLSTEQIALFNLANSYWSNLLSTSALAGSPNSTEVTVFKAGLKPIIKNGVTSHVNGLFYPKEYENNFLQKAEIAIDVGQAFLPRVDCILLYTS